jgi:hypothetical protein
VWHGNTSQRPSTIGIQTSTILIVASFSNTAAGVSPDYVLTVCDKRETELSGILRKGCAPASQLQRSGRRRGHE